MEAAGWGLLPDEMVGRIVALVNPAVLQELLLVETRTRPVCEARLRSLAAPRLHKLARSGDTARISAMFHEHNAPVLLLLNGRTIIHTAIEARQLDLVQWLVQPLSCYHRYSPLSSGIITPNHHQVTITPTPLPEDQCKGLFEIDGHEALRAAASNLDLEVIDRLLPCEGHYPFASQLPPAARLRDRLYFGRMTREIVVELRETLLQSATRLVDSLQMADAADVDTAAQAEVVRQALQRAHVLDCRLRHSDIEWTFAHVGGIEELEGVKAREDAAVAQGGSLFNWRLAFDPYTPQEARSLSRALERAVWGGRTDLCEWLMDEWRAEFAWGSKGVRLAELTLVKRFYDIEELLKPSRAQTSHSDVCARTGARGMEDVYTSMAVDSWAQVGYACDSSGCRNTGDRYRRILGRDDDDEVADDLCETEFEQLGLEAQSQYERFPPPPPKDCTGFAKVVRGHLKRLQNELLAESRYSSAASGDDAGLKALLRRIAPTEGSGAMLEYLTERGFAPPRLSVVVCAGATWALEWLLGGSMIALDEPVYPRRGYGALAQVCSRPARDLSRQLRSLAPWLASAVAQYARAGHPLTLGSVLAVLAVSRGALAIAELLVARGADITFRLAGNRTLLHVIVRDAPLYAVIWLVENGPAKPLVQRSAGGMSPLHEAIVAGHVPVVDYLLSTGGSAGDEPHGFTWDALGVRSEHEAIRTLAESHRAKVACDVCLPQILRSLEGSDEEVEASLSALLARHASALRQRLGQRHGRKATYARLIRAALEGGRGTVFLRWLYVTSGLFDEDDGLTRTVRNDDYYDHDRVTHDELWRRVACEHGGAAGAAPGVTAALDELCASEARAKAMHGLLSPLDDQLIGLWEDGGAVAEIESVQDRIRELLATAPSSSCTKRRASIYGMSMSTGSGQTRGRNRDRLVFRVKQAACDESGEDTTRSGHALGDFELLAACALNGHLHLVHYLLTKEAGCDGGGRPDDARVGAALATALQWNAPLAAVQALCAYLQGRGVDLNGIQRKRDADAELSHNSEVGVLDNALHAILSERCLLQDARTRRQGDAILLAASPARMDAAFAKVSWLAANTKAELLPGAFARLVDHPSLSGLFAHCRGSDESEEANERALADSQALVLRLTRLCVEVLGASWSDKGTGRGSRGREDTALQILVNSGWMEAVSWLARERGALLQGLVISEEGAYRDKDGKLTERLRQLQEEQLRRWAHVEGAL